jgi:hypothetical protein
MAKLRLHTGVQRGGYHFCMAGSGRTMTGKRLAGLNTQQGRSNHRITLGNAGGKPSTVPLDDRFPLAIRADGIRITQGG